MKWWRSRYVQHLEAENAELRETVKRMLNPQWRYLLYGEEIPVYSRSGETREYTGKHGEIEKDRIKLPGRKTWADTAKQLTYLMSPQAIIDKKQAERESQLHAVNERI